MTASVATLAKSGTSIHDASRIPGVGLLDTSVVVNLPTLSPDDLPAFPAISPVTLAELSVGPHVTWDAVVQAQRQLVLQVAEASFDPMPFDARMAATPLAHDLPL